MNRLYFAQRYIFCNDFLQDVADFVAFLVTLHFNLLEVRRQVMPIDYELYQLSIFYTFLFFSYLQCFHSGKREREG